MDNPTTGTFTVQPGSKTTIVFADMTSFKNFAATGAFIESGSPCSGTVTITQFQNFGGGEVLGTFTGVLACAVGFNQWETASISGRFVGIRGNPVSESLMTTVSGWVQPYGYTPQP